MRNQESKYLKLCVEKLKLEENINRGHGKEGFGINENRVRDRLGKMNM